MKFSGKISLIISMIIFGTIGIFVKYIVYSSAMIAMIRGIIGALFLFLVHALRKDKYNVVELKNNMLYIIISGALIGFNWVLLFESYKYTTVSIATVCYYMEPVFVVIASIFLFKERPSLKRIICVIVALIGIVFVSGMIESDLIGIKGVIIALIAALMYACVILLNKKIKNLTSIDRTSFQLLVAGIVVIPYFILTEDFSIITFNLKSVILLVIVCLICTGVAYALYFGSIEKVETSSVAILSYIDPIVSIVLSFVILAEKVSLFSWIGIILIIASAIISETNIKSKN